MSASLGGTTMNATLRLLAAAILAAVLAGCGSNDTASLVASGKGYLEKGDLPAAIIQLRNAKQKAPENAEVRFLLGRALLGTGDIPGAEADLRRAWELKHPPELVLPPLAQALLALGETRKLLQEIRPDMVSDPAAKADIAATIAAAHLGRNDLKEADASAGAALAAQPNNVRALMIRAHIAGRRNDAAGANAAIDAALAINPKDAEAVAMKAGLLSAEGRGADAIALLEQAITGDAPALPARATLVTLWLAQGKVAEAEPVVAAMKKAAPGDFRTATAEAMVALAKKDATKARDLLQPLVAARSDHAPTLFLFALANYELKNYAAADDALRKVIAQAPVDPAPRRVLAATLLRTGRGTQAVELLEEALRTTPNDVALLRLAGEARISAGNVAEASRYYERAASVEKQGTQARLRLAQIRFATGDAPRALEDLEKLSAADPGQIQADLALYAAHLRRREFAPALAAVDAIEKKQPNSAIAAELRANVYIAQRRNDEARKHLNRALELEPSRVSAARSLALLDLQEGKVADAKARYEKVIAAAPRNEAGIIGLAELLAFSGAPEAEVRAALDRAIAVNPASTTPHRALIAQLRRTGDARGALEAARAAVSAFPNDAQLVETLGVLQMQVGETTQARETFARLVQLQPTLPAPLIRLSEAYVAAKDFNSAIETQRKAIALQSDHLQSYAALVATYMLAGRTDEAMAEARKLQKDRPKEAVGFLLEAEILVAQRKPAEAAAAMKQVLARQPNAALAARTHVLLAAAGKTAEANAFAASWAKEHPKDATFHNLVGQHRQGARDYDGAIASYRAALAIEPENVVVLNNVAWLYNERGRPEAKEYAERAYRLAPLNANIVDTYGHVLIKQGDTKRGFELLRQATRLSPQDARLRIGLAKALIAAGDKAGARVELEVAAKADPRSPARAEAEKLLSEL